MLFRPAYAILRLISDLLSRLEKNILILMILFKFFLNYINFQNYILIFLSKKAQLKYKHTFGK